MVPWPFVREGFVLTIGRPFALELFCGSARLSRSMRLAGLDAWGVEWSGCRLVHETPAVLHLDLATSVGQRLLWDLLRHPDLVCVTLVPPCGTSSRAREIPLGDGSAGPPPLRSMDFTMAPPHKRPPGCWRHLARLALHVDTTLSSRARLVAVSTVGGTVVVRRGDGDVAMLKRANMLRMVRGRGRLC